MNESTRRLFFALWPDEALRIGIVERREKLGSVGRRKVPDRNLHLTLEFLGDQHAGRLPEIEDAAARVSGASSTLELDRFGWFPGARVVWLGGVAPAALVKFRGALHQAMLDLGLRLDPRPFKPHVTLFRKVSHRPDLPDPVPLAWPVVDFALVESLPGQPYRLLGRWPLAPA